MNANDKENEFDHDLIRCIDRSIEWKDDDDRSEEEKEKKGGRFNEKKNITIYRNHTDNQMIQYKKFVRILEIKQTQKC